MGRLCPRPMGALGRLWGPPGTHGSDEFAAGVRGGVSAAHMRRSGPRPRAERGSPPLLMPGRDLVVSRRDEGGTPRPGRGGKRGGAVRALSAWPSTCSGTAPCRSPHLGVQRAGSGFPQQLGAPGRSPRRGKAEDAPRPGATLRLLLRGAVFFRLEQLPAPDAEPGSGAARVPGRCEVAPWEPASRKGSRGPAMLSLARPPRRHCRWSEWPSLPGPPPLAPHAGQGASVFGAFLGLRAHPHD